jgi:hypothetical protein
MDSVFYLLSVALVLGFCFSWVVALVRYPFLRILWALDKKGFSDRSSNFWFTLGVLPLGLGFCLMLFSVVFAWLSSANYLLDHCLEHQGHPHLCLNHITHNPPGGVVFWGILASGLIAAAVLGARISQQKLFTRRLIADAMDSGLEDDHSWVAVLPSALPAAFTAGFFRPRPYLTVGAMERLSQEEMSIVVSHELAHARNRDPLRGLLLQMCESWLPGARWIRRRWEIRREVECDGASIRSGFKPKQVAHTILKLQEALTPFGSQDPVLSYSGREPGSLKYRVESLLSDRSQEAGQGPSVLWVAAAIFTALGFGHYEIHHILESFLGWLT